MSDPTSLESADVRPLERYETTISVRVLFDAETSHEAESVAEAMADAVSLPVPTGRAAELLTVYAQGTRRHGAR